MKAADSRKISYLCCKILNVDMASEKDARAFSRARNSRRAITFTADELEEITKYAMKKSGRLFLEMHQIAECLDESNARSKDHAIKAIIFIMQKVLCLLPGVFCHLYCKTRVRGKTSYK